MMFTGWGVAVNVADGLGVVLPVAELDEVNGFMGVSVYSSTSEYLQKMELCNRLLYYDDDDRSICQV